MSHSAPECPNSSHNAALVSVTIVSLLLIITLATSTALLTLYLLRHRKHCSSKDSQNDQKKSVTSSSRIVECNIEAYDGTASGHLAVKTSNERGPQIQSASTHLSNKNTVLGVIKM